MHQYSANMGVQDYTLVRVGPVIIDAGDKGWITIDSFQVGLVVSPSVWTRTTLFFARDRTKDTVKCDSTYAWNVRG